MANIVSTGGWALVFAVEDIATGKEYALKVKKYTFEVLQIFFFTWNVLYYKIVFARNLSPSMKMRIRLSYKK